MTVLQDSGQADPEWLFYKIQDRLIQNDCFLYSNMYPNQGVQGKGVLSAW